MKIESAVIGSLVVCCVVFGVLAFPSPAGHNQEAQNIHAWYGGLQSGNQVEIPVMVMGAEAFAGMQLEVSYDPEVLRAINVEKGDLTGGTEMEYSLDIPGRAIIEIDDSNSISGLGSLVLVVFDVVGKQDMVTDIDLENLKAWDTLGGSKVRIGSLSGSFRVTDLSIAPPVIVFPQ